jgi:hypothetical protein
LRSLERCRSGATVQFSPRLGAVFREICDRTGWGDKAGFGCRAGRRTEDRQRCLAGSVDDRAARENKPAKWEEVGDAIRRAWAVALPEKYRASTELGARVRAGAIVQSVDLSALPESPDRPPAESTPELRRRQFREFWLWLASERYRKAAEAMLKIHDRPDLAAYANRFEETARELQSRTP